MFFPVSAPGTAIRAPLQGMWHVLLWAAGQ